MKVHGNCFCKAISYEAEVSPDDVVICHCVDCQILSGTAYRVSVRAAAENFRMTKGSPKNFLKVAESGNKRVQAFCADCGTPLYATDAGDAGDAPRAYALRVGMLAERGQLSPRKEIWCRSALPWTAKLETTARAEKQS